MGKIVKTKLIEASKAKDYQVSLEKAIEKMQSADLEVEVGHAMCRAQKGVGYLYSAVVTGRQA